MENRVAVQLKAGVPGQKRRTEKSDETRDKTESRESTGKTQSADTELVGEESKDCTPSGHGPVALSILTLEDVSDLVACLALGDFAV